MHLKLLRLRKKIESFEKPIVKLLYKRSLYKQNLSNFENNYLSIKFLNKNGNIEFNNYIDLVITPLCEIGEDSFLKKTKKLNKRIIKVISKRINLGKKVGKLKLKKDYKLFSELKSSNNIEKIKELITNSEIENKIIERISTKATLYFKDDIKKIESVKFIYENIIKKTKEIQIKEIVKNLAKL